MILVRVGVVKNIRSVAMDNIHICLGSQSPPKLAGVKGAFSSYPFFKDATYEGVSVPSGVADQPMSEEETVQGAQNRAKGAFSSQCFLSVGIESGMKKSDAVESGWLDQSIAVLYDGKRFFVGWSPSIALPTSVVKPVLEEGVELSEAFRIAGFVADNNIGKRNGFVGLLTHDVLTRETYTQCAVVMAIAHYHMNVEK